MAANLSDIAAMGARPILATVVLGLPPSIDERWILDCYRGMQALAARHATRIVGGDIVRAPATILSITVVGEVSPSRLKRRDGGKQGDVLAVTGPLGASRAGLELLRRSVDVDGVARERAMDAFATPEPRVAEGRWFAASRNVHAMMDCSDGLSLDVDRLARASGCGATFFDVTVAPAAAAVASAAGDDPLRYALEGGEDFELIVAIAPRAFRYLARRFEAHFKRPLLVVGRLDAELGLRIREDSEAARELVPAGWDHLG
jgi:thiamine-monophosphate kinase